jgi:hypothetical protein
MSNIATLDFVDRRHLFHCAAVALALATAFVVAVPKPDMAAAGTTDNDAKAACLQTCCLQTWPYYERSCLRDDRRRDGNAGAVRVIAINEQARHHVSRQ